jgi:putative tricarboxylic transport membrane protein
MINKLSKIILAVFTYFTLSVSSFAFEASNPQCIAPANAGGGWDFTCSCLC